MINFEYYKIFYYAAKYKNFTKAASFLSTSQSAISHAMQNLEYQLGCRLFTRSNRGIALTDEGQKLYSFVEPGCQQFFKGESLISQAVNLETGTVHIATTVTAFQCSLADAITGFAELFPNVNFKLSNFSTSGEAAAAVKNAAADISVVPSPVEVDPPLKKHDILRFKSVLVASRGTPPPARMPLHISELENYPFIFLAEHTAGRRFFDEILQKYGVTLDVHVVPATNGMVLPLVMRGVGLGFLPEPMVAEELSRGSIYKIPLAEDIPDRSICVVHDPTKPKSLSATAFYDYLIESSGLK
jgi:DNA-binding transcriptional LysR family regulator